MQLNRWIVLALVLLTVPSVQAGTAHLTLMSPPGELIGQGQNFDHTYTGVPLGAVQVLNFGGPQPSFLQFSFGTVTPLMNTFAMLAFSTDKLGVVIAPGTYLNAQRAGFESPGHPGLDVTFQNRGANTLTGQFTVNEASFFTDSLGNLHVASFDATFLEHADGEVLALTGELNYQSNVVVPEPAGLALATCALLGLGLGARCRQARS
jgi:hypothetical protein